MVTKYLCPHCQQALNVHNNIVLRAKNNLGERGLVFLHTELGNYTSEFSKDFYILKGDKVKFSCPLCHHNLSNTKNEKLASFIMVDDDGKESQIVFSRIYGEECTYKIEEKEEPDYFGKHFGLYNETDWLMFF